MLHEVPRIRLKDEFQITVFICFLLSELGTLTENQILEIATFNDVVGVFDLTQALGVVEEKNLANLEQLPGDKAYSPNETGLFLVHEFIARVPVSVREKSIEEGKRILHIAKLRKSLDWRIVKSNNGYAFKVKLLNEISGEVIMEISINAHSEENAKEIEQNFLEKPADIVYKTFYAFMGDWRK